MPLHHTFSGKKRFDMEEIKKTLEEVRNIFANDRFATENGAVIDSVGDHTATCSLTVTPHHKNAMNALMGSRLHLPILHLPLPPTGRNPAPYR